MNKTSKRLFSIGLSVATCSMLVYPVFAEDTDQTLKTESTQVQDQVDENESDLVHCEVKFILDRSDGEVVDSSIFKVNKYYSESEVFQYIVDHTPEGYKVVFGGGAGYKIYVDENGVYCAIVKKDVDNTNQYQLNVVYEYENRSETIPFTLETEYNWDEIYLHIINNYVPEGYTINSCYELNGVYGKFELHVCKYSPLSYRVYLDGEKQKEENYKLPSVFTNEQIMEYLARNGLQGYEFVNAELQEDGFWNVYYKTPDNNNDTYTLIINKDGKDEKSTIKMSKEDKSAYGNVEYYMIKNYVPDGYRIDYNNNNGFYSIGTNMYRMYLVKNKVSSNVKTFTLELTKSNKTKNSADVFEDATVEYHTFEYDSSTLGIEEYMVKKFLPKGYTWDRDISYETEVFRFIAYKVSSEPVHPDVESSTKKTYYVEFLDTENNNELLNQYTFTVHLSGDTREKVKATELGFIIDGYVPSCDTFNVVEDGDGRLVIKAFMKKGEYQVPVHIKFYKEENGKLVKVASVNKYAQEIDTDNNNELNRKELQKLLPKEYFFERIFYPAYYKQGESWFSELNLEYKLVCSTTVVQSEESKRIASIENENLHKVLNDSLTKEQKSQLDLATTEGKIVGFRPILKDKIDSGDEEKLLEHVDKEKNAGVVSSFDIEIQLYVDDVYADKISETSSDLIFKVAIPEELQKEGRKFYVLRHHDGKVEKLEVSNDGSFKSNKFSSYMLIYEDVGETKPVVKPEAKPEVKPEVKPETKPEVKPETKPVTKPEIKPEVKPETKPETKTEVKPTTKPESKKDTESIMVKKESKTVNTGVRTATTLFSGLMGISMAVLGIVEILKRKK